MKHTTYIWLILICFSSFIAKAQIAIGKTNVEGNSTLLDFSEVDENDEPNIRGIILPAVETAPSSPVNGTFIFDKSDSKIKVYENDTWKTLSPDEGGDNTLVLANINTSDDIGEGTIIGAETSSAEGVLVLESDDRAMILPKVASPHINVKSPYPGMMCYDTVTKALAVFDGTKWSYWR